MKLRNFRIAWSVAWGVVAVLLCVLWVRSYWWVNSISYRDGTQHFALGARQGGLAFERIVDTDPRGWRIGNRPVDQNYRLKPSFYVLDHPTAGGFRMPLWFPVILSATFAAVPWKKWSRRFSLRTLLIATTLVAVVLGIIVWMSRAG